jgi:tetratricopeptide (TPR) repeat protein
MKAQSTAEGALTQATYLHELGLAQDERGQGQLRAAVTRLLGLLKRIEAQREGMPRGRGSFQHCNVLDQLADCLSRGGQHKAAEERLHEAFILNQALLAQEPENHSLIGQRASLLHGLGDVYGGQGQYAPAKASYEGALTLYKSIQNRYNEAVLLGQLGTLALRQHDYTEARSRFQTARDQFHELEESAQEAVLWNDLGYVADDQQEWSEAEHCYRESLVLRERLGDLVGAARTCTNLAILALNIGHAAEAEGWYQRALVLIQQVELNSLTHAVILRNLASLLVDEVQASRMPLTRLEEARSYMEQVQRIEEQPGVAAESWKMFGILAKITQLQGQQEQARDYRHRGSEAFAAFAGNRYHIDRQHGKLIADIARAAQGDDEARVAVEEALPKLEQRGWHISAAVQRIWAGERDWHALVDGIDRNNALLVLRVLETLAAPDEVPVAPVADEGQSMEQAVASLPPALVAAMQEGDQAAVQQVFEGLGQDEQVRVMGVLQWLQEQQGEEEE